MSNLNLSLTLVDVKLVYIRQTDIRLPLHEFMKTTTAACVKSTYLFTFDYKCGNIVTNENK